MLVRMPNFPIVQPAFRIQKSPISQKTFDMNSEEAYVNYLKKLVTDQEIAFKPGLPNDIQAQDAKLYMSYGVLVSLNTLEVLNLAQSPADGHGYYIPTDNDIHEVMRILQTLILKEQIALLKDLPVQKKQFIQALDALALELEKPWTADNYMQNLQISDHFIMEIEKRKLNPVPSFEEVEQSAKELDHRLNGKPPVSASLKAAVFGVIGALVGLALGIVIGAASTWYAGGIGAFPAGVKAAFTGAALGTTLAQGGALGMLAAAYGFFNAKRAELKPQEISHVEFLALNCYPDNKEDNNNLMKFV